MCPDVLVDTSRASLERRAPWEKIPNMRGEGEERMIQDVVEFSQAANLKPDPFAFLLSAYSCGFGAPSLSRTMGKSQFCFL
jgi:hypothetical protein